MASRSMRASYEAPKPRKGPMTLLSSKETTWGAFRDGEELLGVTDPYEFPVFYHMGRGEDGRLHVLWVEEHDYPLDPWEDQTELERQLARVREMDEVHSDSEQDLRSVIRAMNDYVMFESPEAKAEHERRWEKNRAEAERVIAETRASKPKKPHFPVHERSVPKRSLVGGLFLTFGGNR